MDLSRPVLVQHHSYLPICPILTCPLDQNLSNQAALGPDFAEPISNYWMDLYHLKLYGIVWTCSCGTSWLFDLDLGFSRSNFENAVSQEWKGRLTWNERDVSR